MSSEPANTFDTRDDCLEWINDRIVRFKLKMVAARTPAGDPTYVPQKIDGRIHDSTAEGFKESGTDEPLSNYAAPKKQDNKWVAYMKLQG
jgi:hypothetical protein